MRKIKYKLYHPEYGKIFRVVNIAYNKDEFIKSVTVPMKDVLPEHYGDTDLVLDFYPKHKIELLEFTGHYDIDGIEIYTGYIVSFIASGDRSFIGAVEWNNSSASYVIKAKNHYQEYFNEVKNLKVLGNIYENKELINETPKV
nr:MAG TPA: YopX protein [Caudoviricetes sp.]